MNINTPAANAGSLTEALRERTRSLHTAAERTGVINDILKRKADRFGYAMLLRNILPGYREMEQALRRLAGRPIFHAFARAELYRADRLAADLAALNGPDWESDKALPAAELYAAQIAKAAEGDGGRLIAHAYVRYFGDLSGGQILKGLLKKTLGLSPDALSFYDFPDIADPADFKNAMRKAIDFDVASQCDPETVIDEAKSAFEHNIAISKAVQARISLST
jgi:heme oxygenase (biliverdin-producing, ferredoxin)